MFTQRAARLPLTARSTVTGNSKGFTLIEVLIVMTLIAVLAAIAVPSYRSSVIKAREATLLEDLYVMRDSIDKYYSDKGSYPVSLSKLVEGKYIRSIPMDPFTNSSGTWVELYSDGGGGVFDVQSGSSMIGRNGVPYNEW
ncbi:MAG: prepilin-type N-terminal cleavage/methylation domain-containing protein [Deltaproteobacteria bacterium]|nr:prepilin-type N-terminal cleavage/methylation domain-containing protein [Deltaproteobacteria bacterium]